MTKVPEADVPEADVTILSSYVDKTDVEEMLKYCKRRYANVAVVFLSNALSAGTQDISELPWQERLVLNNPPLRAGNSQDENIENQLGELAVEFGDQLGSVESLLKLGRMCGSRFPGEAQTVSSPITPSG